jgi:hypothetical protein
MILVEAGMEEIDPEFDDVYLCVFKMYKDDLKEWKKITFYQFYEIYEKVLKENSIHPYYDRVVEECTVCLDRETDITLQCGHHFCEKCISAWTVKEDTCPMCREIIKEKYVEAKSLTQKEIAKLVVDFIEDL